MKPAFRRARARMHTSCHAHSSEPTARRRARATRGRTRRPERQDSAMPTLKDQLRTDLTAAMKARDETRTRTLRMALTAITNEEVSGDAAHDLTDEEITKILTREAKRRREAATAFADAGRDDQAGAERAEEEVLAGYLPAQLSDDELAALVAAAIAETGASGPAGMGQVMKVVTPQVAGRADGSRVAAMVRSRLAG